MALMFLKPPKTIRNLFIGSMIFLTSQICIAQSDTSINNKWTAILQQHKSGFLDDTSYFKEAEKVAEKSFKDSTLKDKLDFFKELAWGNNKYQRYRVKYYAYLTNNASYTHNYGASVYYSEKMEEELKKVDPYMNSLNTTRLKFAIYRNNKTGAGRRITEFNTIVKFLEQLPQNIRLGKAPAITCINSMSILKNCAELFRDQKDSSNAALTLHLAENILKSLKLKKVLDEGRMRQCQYMLYRIRFSTQMTMNDSEEAKKNLDSAFAFIKVDTATKIMAWQKTAIRLTALQLVDFYKEQKNYDSADYYLQISKNDQINAASEIGDGDTYLLSYGKLKAAEGYYDSAYNSILKAYEIQDSIIGLRTADINNNMYAQLIAIQKTSDLKKVELQKKQRNILILSILIISAIGLFIINKKMIKREQEAKDRINKLKFTSQLQIIELEEKQRLIKLEENKKIGRELHDNLVNTIAALKFKIEEEIHKNFDSKQVDRLKSLSNIADKAYESVRNKSHQLYYGLQSEPEMPFSERINIIAENSISASQYTTDISIDDDLSKNVSPTIKIEILHIIQEAITNIIKHAKANKISILFYEDISGLVLNITDNGKGFNTSQQQRKGIGLSSIKDRATANGGTVDIVSGSLGTELTVTIPFST